MKHLLLTTIAAVVLVGCAIPNRSITEKQALGALKNYFNAADVDNFDRKKLVYSLQVIFEFSREVILTRTNSLVMCKNFYQPRTLFLPIGNCPTLKFLLIKPVLI